MNEPDPRKYKSEGAEVAARAATAAAWVSGIFALVFSALIIANHLQVSASAPLKDEQLQAMRKTLQENPDNPALRERIRAYDLLARRAFFTSQSQVKAGGFLLLLAVAVFLAAAKTGVELRRRHPLPGKCPGAGESRPGARWAAAVGGGAIAVTALALALLSPTADLLSAGTGAAGGSKPPGGGTPPFCEPDPIPDHAWPCLRGPWNRGIASHAEAPLKWNGPAGENVRWKTPVPKTASNSPVVWGNRVFLTGADKATMEVYGFDADTGALVWKQEVKDVPGSPAALPEVMESTGFAAATSATDGKRVYAIFATGNVVAYTLDGTRVWARHLEVPKNPYGHASSLVLFPSRLLVQFDTEKGGRLLALDPQTGKTIWDQSRPVKISWATPTIVNTGSRMEALLNSKPSLVSHDPVTGKILWSVPAIGQDGEVAPSVAYADGIAFSGTEHAVLAAVQVGPAPRVLWKYEEDLPDVSTPVAAGKVLILASSGGAVTCLEAATGKPVWRQEFKEGFYSSPVVAGDRIYLMDKDGVTIVFRISDKYEELARNVLGEKSGCTPAFPKGRIYIRGEKHLYCIGKGD
jgi:outer membrane protein assembly factor BamB